jgi:hypothetical protein
VIILLDITATSVGPSDLLKHRFSRGTTKDGPPDRIDPFSSQK